jgi:hypothetical protein
LLLIPAADFMEKIGIISMALKLYIAVFCFMFVITELYLPIPIVRSSALLQNYISRGVLYSFIGLICMEESDSQRIKDILGHDQDQFSVGWEAIFMQISSWFMIGIGLLYVLLGIFCMKRVRDRMKENENQAWSKYRQAVREWKTKYGV